MTKIKWAITILMFLSTCLFLFALGVSLHDASETQKELDQLVVKHIGLEQAVKHVLEYEADLYLKVETCNTVLAAFDGKYFCDQDANGLMICTLFSLEGKEQILRLKCEEW